MPIQTLRRVRSGPARGCVHCGRALNGKPGRHDPTSERDLARRAPCRPSPRQQKYDCCMASTWTVEDGKAVWDGRRLEEWLAVLTADLVAEFDPVVVWIHGPSPGVMTTATATSTSCSFSIPSIRETPSNSRYERSGRPRQVPRSTLRSPTLCDSTSEVASPAPSNERPSSTDGACIDVADPADPSATTAHVWLDRAADV